MDRTIIHQGEAAGRAPASRVAMRNGAAHAVQRRQHLGVPGHPRPRPHSAPEPEPLYLELRRAIEGA